MSSTNKSPKTGATKKNTAAKKNTGSNAPSRSAAEGRKKGKNSPRKSTRAKTAATRKHSSTKTKRGYGTAITVTPSSGDRIFLSFKYDARFIEVVKSQSYRRWYPDKKAWEIKSDALDEIIKECREIKPTLTVVTKSSLGAVLSVFEGKAEAVTPPAFSPDSPAAEAERPFGSLLGDADDKTEPPWEGFDKNDNPDIPRRVPKPEAEHPHLTVVRPLEEIIEEIRSDDDPPWAVDETPATAESTKTPTAADWAAMAGDAKILEYRNKKNGKDDGVSLRESEEQRTIPKQSEGKENVSQLSFLPEPTPHKVTTKAAIFSGDKDGLITTVDTRFGIKVNIITGISRNLKGDYSGFITMQKYSEPVLEIIKNEPRRHYHKDEKCWEIPRDKVKLLIKKLTMPGEYPSVKREREEEKDYKHVLPETNPATEKVKATEKKKEEEKKNLPAPKLPRNFKMKTPPFAHQTEGILHGLANDKFVLTDGMGLGKTYQALGIAIAKKQQRKYKHCLIIVGINGLKWNWMDEIAHHTFETGHILGSYETRSGELKVGGSDRKLKDITKLTDDYFQIINVEALRNKDLLNALLLKIEKKKINMIIMDELHKCCTYGSQQSKAMIKLAPESIVGLTGTPYMNRPTDLYLPLKWMGEEKGSLWKFNKRYCVYGGFQNREIVGYTSMSELKERFDRVSLRRTKEGVLDLPEKVQITEYVEMDKEQEKIYISVKKGMQEEIDRIKLSKTPLSMFTRLRQATSLPPILSSSEPKSAKIERAFELATEAIEEGNKVVIFSNWTTVTDSLMKKFSLYNPALITGQVKDEMRGSEKDRFMNDEECKICIGSIAAMGTGLTLTSANTVIFIDEPWTKAIKDQCEDRCHRIGTKNTVFVYTLITKNTVDERVNSIVEYKGKMSDFILGEGDMPTRIKKIAGMDTSEVVDFLNS